MFDSLQPRKPQQTHLSFNTERDPSSAVYSVRIRSWLTARVRGMSVCVGLLNDFVGVFFLHLAAPPQTD